MAEVKRYYWLKLNKDFFTSKRIKKLRRLAGGDTFTIIYLKMQLLSLTNNGCLVYTGLENSFEEELALDIDEDADNVKVTVSYLLSCGLLETSDSINYFLPFVEENTGSETASTQRVRDYRNRQKALQCNTNVTEVKQVGNVEIEKEKELEIEKDIYNSKAKRFTPPTVDEVKEYCLSRNNNVDANKFVDFYTSKGWLVGKNKMKDWKAAVRTWEGKNKNVADDTWKGKFGL